MLESQGHGVGPVRFNVLIFPARIRRGVPCRVFDGVGRPARRVLDRPAKALVKQELRTLRVELAPLCRSVLDRKSTRLNSSH